MRSNAIKPRRLLAVGIAATLNWVLAAHTQEDAAQLIKTDQYKRIHLQGLRPLVDGHPRRAYDALQAHNAAHPDDPETYFAIAAALSQLGRLEEALEAAEQAIALGLPAERFVAGPREWFAPLRALPAFMELVEQHTTPLVHGPMLGNVAANRASVWLRTRNSAEITVRYRAESDGPWRETDVAATSPASDYTAVVHLHDLNPATRYTYAVYIDGEMIEGPAQQAFTTFPDQGAPSTFRIVFGGGAGYVPPHERVWDEVRRLEPQALLLLGDNVYIDDPERPAIQRFCYYRRQARPEWRRLVGDVPVFAVWDDHDFGTNDCLGGPAIDEPAWKRSVWRVFRRNWANPAYGGGTRQPGCWFRFQIGDVEFFMLDSRYYRTDPQGPAPSMLGPAQKAWLFDGLAASDATFKMLVSPVPVVPGTKGDSDDTWDGYPDERDELFQFVRDERIEGLVVLSADRHRSDVWRIDRPEIYPVYEFESSRFTNQHVHREMEAALFSYNDTQSFGQLDFDTTADDPSLTYTIVSIDGANVHEHTVRASELRFD